MWQEKDGELYKKFEFKDFQEAFAFMQSVAVEAEKQQHHPRWHNEWNKVEIWLSTHDAGSQITDKDRKMAEAIDNLFETRSTSLELVKSGQYKKIKLYADGGSRGNPGPSASGFVLLNLDDSIIFKSGVYLGITTNNQAEYQAVKYGLEEALKLGAREVSAYLDSLLVVNQMNGSFKVRNRDLWPIHDAIKQLITKFKKVTFTHVPRELNKLADAEVNETLDAELQK
jgi:ribonuclease HI/pterin-4a-carbinolamine dehydratase